LARDPSRGAIAALDDLLVSGTGIWRAESRFLLFLLVEKSSQENPQQSL
jgi:hypothetical protein